jgi:multidrug resistance efflux pump
MKILLSILLLSSVVFAKVYYAKVEPFEIRDISSNVSGLVLYADESLLGKKLTNKPYIRIDSELDVKELKYLKEKLKFMQERVAANEKILHNLEESLKRKRLNYDRVSKLKFKSSVEKDREFYDLISSENLFLNTKKEIQNLEMQIRDMQLRKAQLERNIEDKNLSAPNFILYEMLVKPGKVVSKSTPLARVADLSKAKLTIYLDEADVINSNKKTIYLDGK